MPKIHSHTPLYPKFTYPAHRIIFNPLTLFNVLPPLYLFTCLLLSVISAVFFSPRKLFSQPLFEITFFSCSLFYSLLRIFSLFHFFSSALFLSLLLALSLFYFPSFLPSLSTVCFHSNLFLLFSQQATLPLHSAVSHTSNEHPLNSFSFLSPLPTASSLLSFPYSLLQLSCPVFCILMLDFYTGSHFFVPAS